MLFLRRSSCRLVVRLIDFIFILLSRESDEGGIRLGDFALISFTCCF